MDIPCQVFNCCFRALGLALIIAYGMAHSVWLRLRMRMGSVLDIYKSIDYDAVSVLYIMEQATRVWLLSSLVVWGVVSATLSALCPDIVVEWLRKFVDLVDRLNDKYSIITQYARKFSSWFEKKVVPSSDPVEVVDRN